MKSNAGNEHDSLPEGKPSRIASCKPTTDTLDKNFDPFIFLKGCHGDDWKSSKSL